jgi:hypothetical protein
MNRRGFFAAAIATAAPADARQVTPREETNARQMTPREETNAHQMTPREETNARQMTPREETNAHQMTPREETNARQMTPREETWEGAFAIMRTPFHENLEIDDDSLRRQTDFLARGRVHGMVQPAG